MYLGLADASASWYNYLSDKESVVTLIIHYIQKGKSVYEEKEKLAYLVTVLSAVYFLTGDCFYRSTGHQHISDRMENFRREEILL